MHQFGGRTYVYKFTSCSQPLALSTVHKCQRDLFCACNPHNIVGCAISSKWKVHSDWLVRPDLPAMGHSEWSVREAIAGKQGEQLREGRSEM